MKKLDLGAISAGLDNLQSTMEQNHGIGWSELVDASAIRFAEKNTYAADDTDETIRELADQIASTIEQYEANGFDVYSQDCIDFIVKRLEKHIKGLELAIEDQKHAIEEAQRLLDGYNAEQLTALEAAQEWLDDCIAAYQRAESDYNDVQNNKFLKNGKLPSGTIDYNISAQGEIGSSQNIFEMVSDILLSLLTVENICESTVMCIVKQCMGTRE